MLKSLKKLTYIFLSLIVVISLSSCGGSDFPDDPQDLSYTGILVLQKPNDSYKGTHLLMLDSANTSDRSVLPLRSLSLNLSMTDYLNHSVKVDGSMNEKDDVFEVSKLVIIADSTLDATDDSPVEYMNSDLGFQFIYPGNWALEEGTDSVQLYSPSKNEDMIDTIQVIQVPFKYRPEEAMPNESAITSVKETSVVATSSDFGEELTSFLDKNYSSIGDIKRRSVGSDSLIGAELVDMDVNHVFLYRNGLVYDILFIPYDLSSSDSSIDDDRLVYMDIVNSFKFVGFTPEGHDVDMNDYAKPDTVSKVTTPSGETDEASDAYTPELDLKMTSFESLPFHFVSSYPASWYYSGSSSSNANVAHHYGFSDKNFEDGEEIISLDVYRGDFPSGSSIVLGKNDVTVVDKGENVDLYLTVDGQKYRIYGPSSNLDIMKAMASSISPVSNASE